jgi:hypothetical protein
MFGLLVASHVWRVFEEGLAVGGDPWFLVSTLTAAAMSLWAWRVFALTARSPATGGG